MKKILNFFIFIMLLSFLFICFNLYGDNSDKLINESLSQIINTPVIKNNDIDNIINDLTSEDIKYYYNYQTIGYINNNTFYDKHIFNTEFILFIENMYLLKSDVFNFTKIGFQTYKDGSNNEANSLASPFISKGEYGLLYGLCESINFSAYFGSCFLEDSLYKKNNQDWNNRISGLFSLLRNMYLISWNYMEYRACSTWIIYKHINIPIQFNVYIQF